MSSNLIVLTLEEREKMKRLLSDKKKSWQIIKRLEAIKYADKGYSTKEIAAILCVKINRVQEYLRIYRNGRIDALIAMEKPGRESLLTEQMYQDLEQYIKEYEHTGKKCTRLQKKIFIFERFGITIQESWLAKRLRDRKLALEEEPWR